MALRLKLLLFIIGVPVIAAGIAGASVWSTSARWSRAVDRAGWVEGYAAGAMPGRITLGALCASVDEPSESCVARRIATRILWLALVMAVAGAAMLGGLVMVGRRCAGDRERLVAIFGPAMWLTLAGACALLLANTGLVVLIANLIGVLTGRIWSGLGLTAIVAAGGGLFGIIRGMRRIFRPVETDVLGVVATSDGTAGLRQLVRDVSRKLRATAPDNIVVGLDPEFFVTQATVICQTGELTGRTMYLSLPLCRILSVEELASIIGHELAHFTGADTAFAERFSPIYRGATNALMALGRSTNVVGMIVLRPAFALCRFFLECFREAEAGISRDRELRADRESVRVSDASTAATALVKNHAFCQQWPLVIGEIQKALPAGYGEVNLSEMFAQRVQTMPRTPELLTRAMDGHVPHPTDSHPTLGARLAALGVSLDQVQGAALTVPPQPAIALFTGIEATELTLSHILRAQYDEYQRLRLRLMSQS